MPVEYAFFNDPPLVFIRYHGHILVDELIDSAKEFAEEPELKPEVPHFFDLSQVTSYDIDFTKFIQFMANLADVYPDGNAEQLFVFYAPPGPPAEMAEMARKPWEGSDTILIRIVQTREQAFDILGGVRQDILSHIDALT